MATNPHIRALFYDPHIGTDALYLPVSGDAADVRIIIDRQAEVWDGDVVIRQDTISFMTDQVYPSPHDTVTINPLDPLARQKWELVNRIFDDGEETRWAVRRV